MGDELDAWRSALNNDPNEPVHCGPNWEPINKAHLEARDRRIAELEAEVSKARKQAELAHHAADRWVPCPDHRDKVSTERDGCQVCRAETAEAEVERVRYVIEAARPFPKLLRGVRDSDIRDAVTTLHDRLAALSEKTPT